MLFLDDFVLVLPFLPLASVLAVIVSAVCHSHPALAKMENRTALFPVAPTVPGQQPVNRLAAIADNKALNLCAVSTFLCPDA